MKRTPVNPWSWSMGVGFNQAELVEGHRRDSSAAARLPSTPTAILGIPATWLRSSTWRCAISRAAFRPTRLRATRRITSRLCPMGSGV